MDSWDTLFLSLHIAVFPTMLIGFAFFSILFRRMPFPFLRLDSTPFVSCGAHAFLASILSSFILRTLHSDSIVMPLAWSVVCDYSFFPFSFPSSIYFFFFSCNIWYLLLITHLPTNPSIAAAHCQSIYTSTPIVPSTAPTNSEAQ